MAFAPDLFVPDSLGYQSIPVNRSRPRESAGLDIAAAVFTLKPFPPPKEEVARHGIRAVRAGGWCASAFGDADHQR